MLYATSMADDRKETRGFAAPRHAGFLESIRIKAPASETIMMRPAPSADGEGKSKKVTRARGMNRIGFFFTSQVYS